jgi:hypothetical protein
MIWCVFLGECSSASDLGRKATDGQWDCLAWMHDDIDTPTSKKRHFDLIG